MLRLKKVKKLNVDEAVSSGKHHIFPYQPKRKKSVIVDSLQKLKNLSERLLQISEFAFDTETNTLKVNSDNSAFSCVGISISWGENYNYYIPLGHRRVEDYNRQLDVSEVRRYLKPAFEREDLRLIGHNIKFDMHVMSRLGIHIKTRDLIDTMIFSWLIDENTPNGLKENTAYYLGIDQTHFAEVTDSVTKEVKKEFGLKANSKATFDLVLIDEGAPYALDDAFYTWELYPGLLSLLEKEGMKKIYFKTYQPFIRTLYEMEEQGATVDVNSLKQMEVDIKKDMDDLLFQLVEIAGVKVECNSNQQLSALLFGYSKAENPKPEIQDILDVSFKFKPISATATGAPQVNSDTLWKLSHAEYKTKRKQEGVTFCKLLLQYKGLAKLSSAFIEGLLVQLYDDNKAHPNFNIIGTDSGRISCSNPNLQQLPKAEEDDKYKIRSLFIGDKCCVDREGDFICDYEDKSTIKKGVKFDVERKKIVALDFANLEMRVLAHFSEDKNLLTMFENGDDTHGSTAVNMFNLDCTPDEVKKKYPHLRQAAKVINFMLMYGGGAFSLYNKLKDDIYDPIDLGSEEYLKQYHVKKGEDVAQIYIDKYFETYSGVAKFIKSQKRFAHKHGYVQTLLRRKRRLPDINSNDYKMVAYCERLAVNSAIQGSAADMTMSAQNRVNKDPWFKEHGIYMILQVHDELVFECPEKYVEECIVKVKHYMEHPFGDSVELNLPMRADADSGDSYFEAK